MEHTLGYVHEYLQSVKGTDIGVILCGASMFQTLYEFVIGMHDYFPWFDLRSHLTSVFLASVSIKFKRKILRNNALEVFSLPE